VRAFDSTPGPPFESILDLLSGLELWERPNAPRLVFRETTMKVCKNCGKELTGRVDRKLHCSESCYQSLQERIFIENWLLGIESGTRGKTATSARIKRYLIKNRGDKCERCGWREVNPTTNKVPIELEHIDGIWNNNKIENLILLCPNCHSLTSTYRSLNTGKGRTARKYLFAKV